MLRDPIRSKNISISSPQLIQYSDHTALNVILVCKYKFVAEQPNELTVNKGDLVKFIEKKSNGWLVVKFMDKIIPPGLIPASFVDIAVNDFKHPVDINWLNSDSELGELESDIMHLLVSPKSTPVASTEVFKPTPSALKPSFSAGSSPVFQQPAKFETVARSNSVSSDPTHTSHGPRHKRPVKPVSSAGKRSSPSPPPIVSQSPPIPYHLLSKHTSNAKRGQNPSTQHPSQNYQSVYNATPPQPPVHQQHSPKPSSPRIRQDQIPKSVRRTPSTPSSTYSSSSNSDSLTNSFSSRDHSHVTFSRYDSISSNPDANDVDPSSIAIVNCLVYKNKYWYRVDIKYKTFRYHIIRSYQEFYGLHSSLLDLNLKLPRLPEPFAFDNKRHTDEDEDFVKLLMKRCQELTFYLTKLAKLHSNIVRSWLQDSSQPSRGLKIPHTEAKNYSNDTINQILLPNSVNLIFKKISIKIILHNNDIISFIYNKNEIDSINYLKSIIRTKVSFKHLLIKMPDSFELIDNTDFAVIKNSDKILLRVV